MLINLRKTLKEWNDRTCILHGVPGARCLMITNCLCYGGPRWLDNLPSCKEAVAHKATPSPLHFEAASETALYYTPLNQVIPFILLGDVVGHQLCSGVGRRSSVRSVSRMVEKGTHSACRLVEAKDFTYL